MAKTKKKRDFSSIDAVLADVDSTYGAGHVVRAGQAERVLRTRRIPFGVLPLDYALGGGVPYGKITLLWGLKNSSKTTDCLRLIGRAQSLCRHCLTPLIEVCECPKKKKQPMKCFYQDAEGKFDFEWAERQGVDLEELLLQQPSFGEQSIDVAEALLRTGELDLVVTDSVAFLTPAQELEEKAAWNQPGVSAKMTGRFLRKLVSVSNSRPLNDPWRPTIVLTNQVRHKIGGFGSGHVKPHGVAQDHATTIIVKLKHVNYDSEGKKGEPGYRNLRALIEFDIQKNHSFTSGLQGGYSIAVCDTDTQLAGSFFQEENILVEADRLGLFGSGQKKWSLCGETFKTKSELRQRLLESPAFLWKAEQELLGMMLRKAVP